MTEQAQDAGRLICKIGEDGYVRERGDWIDISEDGQSGRTYVYVDQLVAVRQQIDQYKWRRVDDELPEEDGVYLCSMHNPYQSRNLPMTCVFISATKRFQATFHAEVAHWMPIPPLDQEEG